VFPKDSFYRVVLVAMCGNMYVVCRQYLCSMKVANQSLLMILHRVWKRSEISAKSAKGKVREE